MKINPTEKFGANFVTEGRLSAVSNGYYSTYSSTCTAVLLFGYNEA